MEAIEQIEKHDPRDVDLVMFCVTPAHYLLFVLASIAIVINPILLPSDDHTQFRIHFCPGPAAPRRPCVLFLARTFTV